MADSKKNLLGQSSSGKRKANVPAKPKSASVPGKKDTKVTALGKGPVSPQTDYTKDKPMQSAVKGGQKYGLPYESKAYKSGAEPAEYAKKKKAYKKPVVKKAASSESKSEAPKRTENKPIKGISNTQGMLTRTLPGGDSLGPSAKSVAKGVSASKRTYSDKKKQIGAVMQKGKKKDGTMKASAQRKIAAIRKQK